MKAFSLDRGSRSRIDTSQYYGEVKRLDKIELLCSIQRV